MNEIKHIKLSEVVTGEPFESLFPIRADVLEGIVADMEDNGFDALRPLIIWDEQNILIDGHTRLKAAKAVRHIKEVPACRLSFEDVDEALNYACRLQFNRRNLTDAELITFAQKILNSYSGTGASEYLAGKFSGQVSTSKARQICRIINVAQDPQYGENSRNVLSEVREGELSVNKAYEKLKDAEKKNLSISYEEDGISIKLDHYMTLDKVRWRGEYKPTPDHWGFGIWGTWTEDSDDADREVVKTIINHIAGTRNKELELAEHYHDVRRWMIEEAVINEAVFDEVAKELVSEAIRKEEEEETRKTAPAKEVWSDEFSGEQLEVRFAVLEKDKHCRVNVNICDGVFTHTTGEMYDTNYGRATLIKEAIEEVFDWLREHSASEEEHDAFREWLLTAEYVNDTDLDLMDYEIDEVKIRFDDEETKDEVYTYINGKCSCIAELHDTPAELKAKIINLIYEHYNVEVI